MRTTSSLTHHVVFIHQSLTVIHSSNLTNHTDEVAEQHCHRPRRHGLQRQISHGKVNRGKVVGKTSGEILQKTRGVEQIIATRGGMIPEFVDRSTFSIVPTFGSACSTDVKAESSIH